MTLLDGSHGISNLHGCWYLCALAVCLNRMQSSPSFVGVESMSGCTSVDVFVADFISEAEVEVRAMSVQSVVVLNSMHSDVSS